MIDEKEKEIDLDNVKTFYGPHPGFAGAMVPLPCAARKVAEELDGKSLTLREAVQKIQSVTKGEIKVVKEFKYIALSIKDGPFRHFFKVISYR